MKKVKTIGRPTETVGTAHSGFPSSMVRGWDQAMGLDQARKRSLAREDMGRKKTPIGAGKLKRG